MNKYIAVLKIVDVEEIIDAKVSYSYRKNGINYSTTGSLEFKEESEDAKNKTYEDGLNEAWEAARKIGKVNWLTLEKMGFENKDKEKNPSWDVVMEYSASEAIAKVKEYEEIKVGDEVIDKYGWKKVVTNINQTSGEITVMDCKGDFYDYCKSEFKKTGRHFSQIEEVLKQMQESKE